jgi:ribonuclease T1
MRAALAALLVVCSTALALSGTVRLEALPPQARQTLARIEAGGPFPYARDGALFSNRERQLPARERGYYREYTVEAPGVHGRGPRRIVAGRGGEYYYTDDHYRTFRRIIRP